MSVAVGIEKLVRIMHELRSPEGCPWDRAQTYKSLKRCIIEECAELADALENEDVSNIREELGDIVMLVVFFAEIAADSGDFNLKDVLDEICDKMIRRHPHVFASDDRVEHADEVVGIWEQVKAQEKNVKNDSVLDRIPKSLSPIYRAYELQKKASKFGFEWKDDEMILSKIDEEVAEVKEALISGSPDDIEEEIGDLLFAVICLSRYKSLSDPGEILNNASRKFEKRFRYYEKYINENNAVLSALDSEEMIKIWHEAKLAVDK